MPELSDPNDVPAKKPPIAAPDTEHLSDKPDLVEEDEDEDEDDLEDFEDDEEDDEDDED